MICSVRGQSDIMVGMASGINFVSRDCKDGEVKKPVAFTKIEEHLDWIYYVIDEEKKATYRKENSTSTTDGAETKHLTHLALIAAFCIILMI